LVALVIDLDRRESAGRPRHKKRLSLKLQTMVASCARPL
jgi:hypothetical protein